MDPQIDEKISQILEGINKKKSLLHFTSTKSSLKLQLLELYQYEVNDINKNELINQIMTAYANFKRIEIKSTENRKMNRKERKLFNFKKQLEDYDYSDIDENMYELTEKETKVMFKASSQFQYLLNKHNLKSYESEDWIYKLQKLCIKTVYNHKKYSPKNYGIKAKRIINKKLQNDEVNIKNMFEYAKSIIVVATLIKMGCF